MKKLLIFSIAVLIIMISCASQTNESAPAIENTLYEIFYVEGMPCVTMDRGPSYGTITARYWGVTCDWSQWEGE